MSEAIQSQRKRRPWILILVLCPVLLAVAAVLLGKGASENIPEDLRFSVLILGDSQMAGAGWDGGYENCISETYPGAKVINLAQNGSLLANGDIRTQWEYFLSEATSMPDFVLLDGGINDLPHLRKEEFQDTGMSLVDEALRSLIEQIHQVSPDTHIIYVLMPPFAEWKNSENGPPSYEAQQRYWKQLNISANGYDYVTVVDLFSLNPFQYPSAESYHKYLADSIHLSEAGYRKTFEYLKNILTARLGNS